MERTLLEILTDPENREPVVLTAEDGRTLTFEQIALIPLTVKKSRKLYAILKPADKMQGVGEDEAIVFLVNEKKSELKIETDDAIGAAVFEEYYKLLDAPED